MDREYKIYKKKTILRDDTAFYLNKGLIDNNNNNNNKTITIKEALNNCFMRHSRLKN